MKNLVIASVVAALSGVLVAPQSAEAKDSDVLAALGGFIGGVIVGSQIDDGHVHTRVSYRHHGRHHDTRVVVHDGYGHRNGYWKWVTVRTWVPGHWVVRFDDCGRRVRYFERGHYIHRKERVWISARHDRRGRWDRYDG